MKKGIREELINFKLENEILKNKNMKVDTTNLYDTDAPKMLAMYVYKLVKKVLSGMSKDSDDNKVEKQIDLINNVIDIVAEEYEEDGLRISKPEILKYVLDETEIDKITKKKGVVIPQTSISHSTIFTGAHKEPVYYSEIQKEILSCDKVDIIISFIRLSGLRLIYNQLKEFTDKGGKLRIITTVYMGATEAKAIKQLNELKNTEIKISYETKSSRLHTKSYIFHRENGYTTAYVGSSNISYSAMKSGLEWNMKVTNQDLDDVISNIIAQYNVYWESSEFELYSQSDYEKLCDALNKENDNVDIDKITTLKPYRYQQLVLDKVEVERKIHNNYKNLLVCPTGVGKTAIVGFDYKRFKENNQRSRLLFIAHRKEILEQSLKCFRKILNDPNFGELMVDNYEPDKLEFLFCSVDKFNSREFTKNLKNDYYDYICIDEVHHLAADSYQDIVTYFKPKVLLGLTATPDRLDGKDILKYFNNRISAVISLAEAIEKGMLSTFQYYCITDTTDLSAVKWKNGGYDISQLNDLYVNNSDSALERATNIASAVDRYIANISDMKALGFCTSIEHANFMANYFNSINIPALALSGNSPRSIRDTAKKKLQSGELKVIFVRDIYNEGVDIKDVNTIFFLRPTESKTIFLQQLGRGLRIAKGKECLTVLDFIGLANKNYSYEKKFASLMLQATGNFKGQIINGFNMLPRGCHIILEKKAKEYILDNLSRNSTLKQLFVQRIKDYSNDFDDELNLLNYFLKYDVNPRLVYGKWGTTFDALKSKALEGVEYDHKEYAKILYRLCTLTSSEFIKFMFNNLNNINKIEYESLNNDEKSYIRILYDCIYEKKLSTIGFNEYIEALIHYFSDKEFLINELIQLFKYMFAKLDVITKPLSLPYNNSLEVYGTYTKRQFMAVLDEIADNSISEGVKWLKDKKIDIFFITLNKNHSVSTSYHDYPISESLFNVQTQSKTTDKQATGKRYIETKDNNDLSILLLVRELKDDEFGSVPFTFLGRAKYVSHTGNKPMSMKLELEEKMPSYILKMTDKFGII